MDVLTASNRLLLFLVLWGSAGGQAQEVPREYQVKAAYLFNFVKFVEWPDAGGGGPLTICVAGRNPFGDLLQDTIRGEVVQTRSLETRIVSKPDPGCHVLFLPRGAPPRPYIEALRGSPVLTVGEIPGFLGDGGIINFIIEEGKVRFQIDADAAGRSDLRISSHLLRLARTPAASRG